MLSRHERRARSPGIQALRGPVRPLTQGLADRDFRGTSRGQKCSPPFPPCRGEHFCLIIKERWFWGTFPQCAALRGFHHRLLKANEIPQSLTDPTERDTGVGVLPIHFPPRTQVEHVHGHTAEHRTPRASPWFLLCPGFCGVWLPIHSPARSTSSFYNDPPKHVAATPQRSPTFLIFTGSERFPVATSAFHFQSACPTGQGLRGPGENIPNPHPRQEPNQVRASGGRQGGSHCFSNTVRSPGHLRGSESSLFHGAAPRGWGGIHGPLQSIWHFLQEGHLTA